MTVLVEETTATAAAAAVTKEQRVIVSCWIFFGVGVMCRWYQVLIAIALDTSVCFGRGTKITVWR